jgi:hypothetical protein
MEIIRVKKNDNYTVISNEIFRDVNLSAKERGILCTILSLPPKWDLTINGLVSIMKDGRDSILSGMNDLRANGYVVRERKRVDGKYSGYDYTIYESKISPKSDKPTLVKPKLDNPTTEKPITEKPFTENPIQLSNDIIKDLSNKVINKSRGVSFKIPTIIQVEEYCTERKNNVDAETFCDFYESKGWQIGKEIMKSWKACVRTWEKSSRNNNTNDRTTSDRHRNGQDYGDGSF